jgi:hypothetical protein
MVSSFLSFFLHGGKEQSDCKVLSFLPTSRNPYFLPLPQTEESYIRHLIARESAGLAMFCALKIWVEC